jgi:Protein of unknown function (DUF3152)
MTLAARSGKRPPGRWRRFVRSYGWRAYALPLLAVVTVVCVIDIAKSEPVGGPQSDRAGRPSLAGPGPDAGHPVPVPKPRDTGIYVDLPVGTMQPGMPATVLPAGGPYSTEGANRFDVVPGSSRIFGTGGPLLRYAVDVEAGVAEDGPTFAAEVEQTLGGPKSWTRGGKLRLQRVDGGEVDFRVSLTASMTVRNLCGYTLPYETSCYNGQVGRAVINDARWVRGAVAYPNNLQGYRTYVINHEVGHALGHQHQRCPRAGALAPVMMQQTLGLVTPGVGACRPNPYPYP